MPHLAAMRDLEPLRPLELPPGAAVTDQDLKQRNEPPVGIVSEETGGTSLRKVETRHLSFRQTRVLCETRAVWEKCRDSFFNVVAFV